MKSAGESRVGTMAKKFYHRLRDDFSSLKKLEASPREVAVGAAIGLVLDFIPSFGCGIAISAVLSPHLGGNMTAAIISNVAFGPLIPVFYALNIITGRFLLGRLSPLLAEKILSGSLVRISPAWLLPYTQHRFMRWLRVFGPDFMLGSVINSVLVYFLCRFILERVLNMHKHKLGR